MLNSGGRSGIPSDRVARGWLPKKEKKLKKKKKGEEKRRQEAAEGCPAAGGAAGPAGGTPRLAASQEGTPAEN